MDTKDALDGSNPILKEGWNTEQEVLNTPFITIYIYINVLGVMAYSFFDYQSIPEFWLEFLVYRLLISAIGILLAVLVKRKQISTRTAFTLFLLVLYLFFAYGASLLDNHKQLNSWNFSITIAGVLGAYFIMVVDKLRIILLNIYFSILYLFFFYVNCPLSFSELQVNGGLMMLVSLIAAPFIGHSRYIMHLKNYILKFELQFANVNIEKTNRKLKESNLTKDRFFSIIAHDLKSPFNSMLGFIGMLNEQIQQNNYTEVSSISSIIQKELNQTHSLLENLLSWSRSQTHKIPYKPEELNVTELLSHAINMQKFVALKKGIEVIMNSDPELLVYADKNLIKTILRNLISNAIKYTNTGGCIQLLAEEKDNEVIFKVSDNGVGMLPDEIEKLFKMEYSMSRLGTNMEQGTGLGLLLCKEFIEINQGRIWVESRKDKGSVFIFVLPKKRSVIPIEENHAL